VSKTQGAKGKTIYSVKPYNPLIWPSNAKLGTIGVVVFGTANKCRKIKISASKVKAVK
jgi:hypothetical protein